MATCYVKIAGMVVFPRMYFQLYKCISDLFKQDLVKDNTLLVSNSAYCTHNGVNLFVISYFQTGQQLPRQ